MFKFIAQKSSCEVTLGWMSKNQTNANSTLVQVMAWCHQAPSHYLNWCWPKSLPTYGITRPWWVNYLRLHDTIWHHRIWSILVQLMTWCLTAQSCHSTQCWLIVIRLLKTHIISIQFYSKSDFSFQNTFQCVICKMSILLTSHEVRTINHIFVIFSRIKYENLTISTGKI